jgi:hypothetical protein
MKTLDQVEPRSPIGEPMTITQSGSFYLTQSLSATGGVEALVIDADHVAIDLNGFVIEGDGSVSGIRVNGTRANIMIRDGIIVNCRQGVELTGSRNAVVDGVHAISNSLVGIELGDYGHAAACFAEKNGTDGLRLGNHGFVWRCRSVENGDDGIQIGNYGVVDACMVASNLYGVYIGNETIVRDCTSSCNGNQGILGTARNTVLGCSVFRNTGSGIEMGGQCRIERNECRANGEDASLGYGIMAGSSSVIRDNVCTRSDAGIRVTGIECDIVNNIVNHNTNNYDIASGNHLNLIISEVPETLEWPCLATLSGTLECESISSPAISITSDDVTLDLGGHALMGPGSPSQDGIRQSTNVTGLTIRNGVVRNFKGAGMAAVKLQGRGARIERVQAIANEAGFETTVAEAVPVVFSECTASEQLSDGFVLAGSATLEACVSVSNTVDGFALGRGSILSGCRATDNGEDGFDADDGAVFTSCQAMRNVGSGMKGGNGSSFDGCLAIENGGVGIQGDRGSEISSCTAFSNVTYGIWAKTASSIRLCTASYTDGDGFRVESNVRISDCTAVNNDRHGIYGSEYDIVLDCFASRNGRDDIGAGVVVWQGSRVEGNYVLLNDYGIRATGVRNLIVRNSALNNSTNYFIASQNAMGTTVVTPMSPAVTGSSGGSGVGSTDPWSNFSH